MGPAGTAVLGDVLIENVGQVVSVVDLVPNPLLGELNVPEGFSLNTLLESGYVGWVVGRDLTVSG